MERIQDAIAQAGTERERHLADLTPTPAEAAARRLRTISPFNEWSEAERLTLVGAGSLLDYAPGATVFRAGDRDDELYFLLEGALSLVTSDGTARLLHAGEGPARHALDDAGVKTATVTAAHPSRVFRISESELSAAMQASAAQPLPAELYSETFSGQQLAALINELATSQSGASEADAVPARATTRNPPPPAAALELDPLMGALDDTAALPQAPAAATAAAGTADDPLAALTRKFELDVRRHVNQERARYRARLEQHAAKLKQRAEELVRARQEALRERFEAAHREREQALNERYRQLLALANQLARQKAAIYAARHQIEDRLKRADQLHRELAELGGQVTSQLDRIDEMIPDDTQGLAGARPTMTTPDERNPL